MNEPAALTAEETAERETPDWAKETVPARFRGFLGKFGLPEPWRARPGPLGKKVKGVDRWHANHFVVYRPETAEWLYRDYTPTAVTYRPGLLPAFERVAAEFAGGLRTAEEKAAAFLTRALPDRFPHATVPPCGPACGTDRGLDDTPLLESRCGFCNEQARVFARLCQVSGIQARLIFLFYADGCTGHTTAEYWTGAHWAMVDVSWYGVFPGPAGRLMSAVECHGNAEQRTFMAKAYRARMETIVAMPDEVLAGRSVPADAPDRSAAVAKKAVELRGYVEERMDLEKLAKHLAYFGIMNYPLPA